MFEAWGITKTRSINVNIIWYHGVTLITHNNILELKLGYLGWSQGNSEYTPTVTAVKMSHHYAVLLRPPWGHHFCKTKVADLHLTGCSFSRCRKALNTQVSHKVLNGSECFWCMSIDLCPKIIKNLWASKLLVRNMFRGFRSRWIMGADKPWRYAKASPVFKAQRIAKLKRGLKAPSMEAILCLSM